MKTLSRELRKELERAVAQARNIAEEGARKAIESLAVGASKPWEGMSQENKALRNQLRAHGRQLGDIRDSQKDTQTIEKLVAECAYEHWHRMLFSRFLAENDLLIEPESRVPISLADCEELAREKGADWLELASSFAESMLPQIFRRSDPVLRLTLPRESRNKLEEQLKGLPSETFLADDSLGWVYQFWQAERKNQINESGKKIGAEELPAVTQLFTEDYMVEFLLHNTLGAWWAGKVLAQNPEIARTAGDEKSLREACSLGGIDWAYLRFVREAEGPWRPAAGIFDGWPKTTKEITILDPCMGSGHFLVFALPVMVALRMKEEKLTQEAAVEAVLKDNLFGLEIDSRCTQIAAFNLALAAWKLVGHKNLPSLNLACSGLAIGVSKKEWLALAEKAALLAHFPVKRDLLGSEENLFSSRIKQGLEKLYDLFEKAPILGSLIDPSMATHGDLLEAKFDELEPFLKPIFESTESNEATEMAVTAKGMTKAAEILAGKFTLVVTNVPYLGLRKQGETLRDYCIRNFQKSKHDLACVFIERCLQYVKEQCSVALVTPRSWTYKDHFCELRDSLLKTLTLKQLAILGPGAFETISGEVVDVALFSVDYRKPIAGNKFYALDLTDSNEKKSILLESSDLVAVDQAKQLENPDHRISVHVLGGGKLLEEYAIIPQGIKTGDDGKWIRLYWELPNILNGWEFCQSSTSKAANYGGREYIIDWRTKGLGMIRPRLDSLAVGKPGVGISQTGECRLSIYSGQRFDSKVAPIVPHNKDHLLAIWMFCTSNGYADSLAKLSPGLFTTNSSFLKIPFDLLYWQKAARETHPNGLPKPFSSDPTQWLFNGHPKSADHALHVATARLLGYQWPRQTGSNFPECPSIKDDGLEKYIDDDGIVCLTPLRGEQAAADRLRALLSDAFGKEWSVTKQNEILAGVDFQGKSLDDWLRDGFFEQHCEIFHQRPFIWHIWDGRRDGFNALVNYHKLAAPEGQGKKTFDKLLYTYLGDWIERQRRDQKSGVEGADARLTAALHLKGELEKIRAGEPPYDLFVRWKPLREQAIGWDPDINDGIRINIRPFFMAKPLGARAAAACILRSRPKIKWEKDRGAEPLRDKADYPWFWGWDGSSVDFQGGKNFDGNRWNDVHCTSQFKKNSLTEKVKMQKQ